MNWEGWMAVAALITAVGSVGGTWWQRRKHNAEARQSEAVASEKITAAALTLLSPLRERVAVLETQVQALTDERDKLRAMVGERDRQIAKLEASVDLLSKQVIMMGGTPFVPPPPAPRPGGA